VVGHQSRKGKDLSTNNDVKTRGPYGDYNIMIPAEWFDEEDDEDLDEDDLESFHVDDTD
jgi:hypothetical protein